jgi:ABC-2 type transport system ATP-binding protein
MDRGKEERPNDFFNGLTRHKEFSHMEPIIRIRGLSKTFGTKEVLQNIDLEVDPGHILGYIGPNGAGKTTTVKILIGMLASFKGTVEVCGFNVKLSPLEVKRRTGYVPETAALYDTLSAMEFLRFVGRLHGMAEEEAARRAQAMLDLFELAAVRNRRLATFSKGMRQKVLITAALIHDPDLIIMDEPLSGLDANTAVVVKEILAGLARQGKTVFYCSHVMDVVERICDRIVILSEGKIIADGSFEALKEMSKASSLEKLFTRLTSEGTHEAVAARFIGAFHGGEAAHG